MPRVTRPVIRGDGATTVREGAASYVREHLRVMVFTLRRLLRSPGGSLLTAAAIGITLALPAGLHVLLQNISTLSYSWESSVQASLFLRDTVSGAHRRQSQSMAIALMIRWLSPASAAR